MLVRAIWRACSAAPAHFAGGRDSITDGIFWESGWTFVAVTLMYTNSPGIPTASSPTPERISETHVGVRLFDIFTRAVPPFSSPAASTRCLSPTHKNHRVMRALYYKKLFTSISRSVFPGKLRRVFMSVPGLRRIPAFHPENV